ncbi:tRNA lysidine(34) synthetase TilS [Oecophyllibacter saccharovorans]|uniref:tRNA(Ile)-lysidine synthase n=1 Tax=Oecophyllibacter saccharovorans TaxID=2558360 RepID=A0A506ULZ9_9PROT|nr:tRNA lysidine(34) synthetase TilS [Oecophyllibacter saccharovorans]TPW34367.1 tRNA lysidine(34) synthetase TilS [Oecophyllibacter saccharovorans]
MEFAALMTRCGADFLKVLALPVAVGVSGGADSMALAWLTRRWGGRVLAFTVDHGLRTEAAQEARLTYERLQSCGIACRVLALEGLGTRRLQERARQHRLARLEEAAWQAGAPALLLAHHRHDQEETLWMRQQGGSDWPGLQVMAASALRGRVAVLRPLLGISPQRLRATLRQAGLPWCEDPSNHNRRFERVRVRQDLGASQRQDLHNLRDRALSEAGAEERAVAGLLAVACRWEPEGWVSLAPGPLQAGGEALAVSALRRLVRLVGGKAYPPSRQATAALLQRGGGSLGGAVLGARRGRWHLVREERGLPAVPLTDQLLWAGRWRYVAGAEPVGEARAPLLCAPLGPHVSRLKSPAPEAFVPRAALAALPGIWQGGRLVAVPAGMRGLQESGRPAVSFIWESGVPVTGARLLD